MKANQKVKDSVFSLYLTEDTKRLVEVYNAIQTKDYPLDTPVEINTLTDALYKDRVNDVSFLLNGQHIVLLEHQSTINYNMPLRTLLYIARLYEKTCPQKNLYRKKIIKLPRPKFFVLYNGAEPYPQESILRLSDSFDDLSDEDKVEGEHYLELIVKVLNIRYSSNNPLLQRSRSLWEYSVFVHQINVNKNSGMSLEDAIHEAVLYCEQRGVMRSFLEKHASEVENMLLSDWNWDDALQVEREEAREEGRAEGHAEGLEEGLAKGQEKERRKNLLALLESLPLEQAARLLKIPFGEAEQLLQGE